MHRPYGLAFRQNRLLLRQDGQELRVPCLEQWRELGVQHTATHYLGVMGNAHCYAVQLADEPAELEGVVLKDLRSVLLTMEKHYRRGWPGISDCPLGSDPSVLWSVWPTGADA